ncbi:hypothetical protein IWW55_000539, partial [Coemansia sp. RSA 2706]
ELAPAVYDEAASIASSPAVSPQAARGPVPPMPRSPAATADPAADSASLRRRMLATRAAADDASQRSVAARDSHGRLRQRTPSIAPSVNSLSSAAATAPALPSDASRQKNAVWTMEFSVCGRYLAAGGQDGVLRVWRIAPFAREQAAEKRQQHGPESPASAVHDSRLEPAAARARAASNHAAAADAGRSHVRQKSAMYADGAEMMPFANSAPIAKGKHLRSFSVGQPMLPARGEPQTSPTGSAADAAPAAPANDRAPAAPEPTAQLHPMHAYELLEPVPFRSYVGHAADILALAWSKNGFLLSASTDRTVRLWHPHRPECLCTFRHRDIVTSVAFNPRDDRLFISGSLDCRLRLWDIPARSVRHWTRLPEGQMVTSVAFTSSRGDYIVAGTYRGMCVFYSTDGLAVQGRMHARSSRGRNAKGSKITGFAHAPTGQMPPALLKRLLGPSHFESLLAHPRLLVSSNDSRLRMFLPGERDLARKYKGHANVSSQAYARLSSDGRYIVSGSEDHNVYVWPAAQDNAATVATHPNSDHIRRVGRAAPVAALNGSHAGRPEKQPLLASLFGRKRNQHEQHEPKPDTPEPQSEEWESLDGKVEEKSIYEYFPAHDAVVSQALFAPAATLQYLADHDDPILSRRKMRRTKSSGDVENVLPASPNATFGSGSIQVPAADDNDDDDDLKHSVEDMTAIIVSADTRGNIRVFRKDINVRRSYAGAENPSHTSLVKAKESMNSLTRAITGDGKNPLEPGDLDIYTMTPAHTAEHKVPPPLQQQHQHGSFWDRLGRRMSQKRHSSTYAGPSKPAAADSRPKARAVSEIHDSVPPSLAAIAEASSGSLEKQAGTSDDVCAHCGNDKFIDFAVAPTASSSAAAPRQLSISTRLPGRTNSSLSAGVVPYANDPMIPRDKYFKPRGLERTSHLLPLMTVGRHPFVYRHHTTHFTLSASPWNPNEHPRDYNGLRIRDYRVAIIAGKKHYKRAHRRWRVTRLVRMAVAQILPDKGLKRCDYVFVLKPDLLEMDRDELFMAVEGALLRIKRMAGGDESKGRGRGLRPEPEIGAPLNPVADPLDVYDKNFKLLRAHSDRHKVYNIADIIEDLSEH